MMGLRARTRRRPRARPRHHAEEPSHSNQSLICARESLPTEFCIGEAYAFATDEWLLLPLSLWACDYEDDDEHEDERCPTTRY
jgi:hypothetical protein